MSTLTTEEREKLQKELSKLKSQKIISVDDKLKIQKLQQAIMKLTNPKEIMRLQMEILRLKLNR